MIAMNKDDLPCLQLAVLSFCGGLLVTTGLTTAAGVSEAGPFLPFTSRWFWIKLTLQVSIFWTAVSV